MLNKRQEERFSKLVDLSLTGWMTDAESRELSALKEERDRPAPGHATCVYSWSDASALWELENGERNTLTRYAEIVRTVRYQDAALYVRLRLEGHTTEELQP